MPCILLKLIVRGASQLQKEPEAMKLITRRALLIGIAMLATAVAAIALKPVEKIAAQGPSFQLETAIPKAFGD